MAGELHENDNQGVEDRKALEEGDDRVLEEEGDDGICVDEEEEICHLCQRVMSHMRKVAVRWLYMEWYKKAVLGLSLPTVGAYSFPIDFK